MLLAICTLVLFMHFYNYIYFSYIFYTLPAVQHSADDLYFCFRWLLVTFKREFNYEEVMRVWEVWCFIGCILYVDRALCAFMLGYLDRQIINRLCYIYSISDSGQGN